MFLNWKDIEDLIDELVMQIKLSGRKIDAIVGIARGGWIPAVILSHKLNIRQVHTIQNVRYDVFKDTDIPVELSFLRNPNRDECLLFIDDIYDTGQTMKDIAPFRFRNDLAACLVDRTCNKKGNLLDFSACEYGKSEWVIFPWENVQSQDVRK